MTYLTNNLLKLTTLSIPLFIAGACSEEFYSENPAMTTEKQPMQFTCGIDQRNDTRADESGFADGDRMGVFVVNYSNGKPANLTLIGNVANNVELRYQFETGKWIAANEIYWQDKTTPADIYGYYPFHNGLASVSEYSFEVAADQSRPAGDGDLSSYESSDFLWAKAENVTPGNKVNLTYSHRMAGVKVILTQGTGFGEGQWDKISKLVTVDNTVRNAKINIQSGLVVTSGDYDRNIVMNPDGGNWRAVVVPQKVASGRTTIGITIDGKPYAYTRDGGMTYSSGKLHTFTIKVDYSESTGTYSLTLSSEDVTPWEADNSSHNFVENTYVTVHSPAAGKLRNALTEAKIDFNTIRNLKVTGTLTTEDFDLMREELLSLTAIHMKEINIVNISYLDYDVRKPAESEQAVGNDIIPPGAFRGKGTLRRIIIPDNVKRIGENAFADLALNSTLIIPESVTRLDLNCFAGIREGSSIVMPKSLEYIGDGAFYECKSDIELRLTNSIRVIGSSAFWGASNIHGTLTIPNRLEHLGQSSLALGNNIDGEIVIPTSLTEIPSYAFYGVNIKGGTKVIFHDGITKIGEGSFLGVNFTQGFTLPPHLKEIGSYAFQDCKFSDKLTIPESVQIIGDKAFYNTNLKGELTMPSAMEVVSPTPLSDCGYSFGSFAGTMLENVIIGDNVEIIGGRAFSDNVYLRQVEIGKNVDRIGMEAFSNCPGLQTVICLAKDPPKLYNNVFYGFDPLHCHLEVPDKSVDLYKTADGWKDFQFISAHRELTVGIHDQSCLNNGLTRSVIIDSEGEWRVKSAPSWIRVVPDHADNKEEITFTINPLARGAGSREGKVIFELVGKDYTTECNFNQIDYSNEEDKEIILQTASANGNPVNLFIVGDGFGADEIANGRYMEIMNQTMEQYFAIEPYKTYRNHFNVATSIAMSPDNKTATLLTRRLNRLNTFGTDLDVQAVKMYTESVSEFITSSNIKDAMIIVVSNIEGFSGSAYPDESGCAMACISLSDEPYPYDQRGLVQHYAGGMAFSGLAPEYVIHNEHIMGCKCPGCNGLSIFYTMKSKGLYENVTLSGKMDDAPWKDFIFHPKYSSMVDMWEGGFNHLSGVWKSEPQSVMGTYIAYYNTISRYAIYKSIMRRAGKSGSLEDFIANDKIELP